jgi:Kef-type K+ transport system membrane component KefB
MPVVASVAQLAPAPVHSPLQGFASSELGYVLLLFALFVVPRVIQRWGIPSAITSFILGGIVGAGFELYEGDNTLLLMSTFGIVALFLFAGLEVDFAELRSSARHLAQHLVLRMALLAGAAVAAAEIFSLGGRPAILIALALLTPSTGFILDSLHRFGLAPEERFWVKSKAIALELLALLVLFVVLQSTTLLRFGTSVALFAAIVLLLPPAFRLFAVKVAPHAPKSEFAFLLMMALVTAYATRRLGVYYLVGAFTVGVAARRFRESLPAMASERMLHAVEVFASFFAPFYFFHAGAELRREDFSLLAIVVGLTFAAITIPVRIAAVTLLRRLGLGEPSKASLRIAVPMLPTLVFTLVIAGLLRDVFAVGDPVFGALIVYAVVTTLAPGLLFGTPPPVFDAPELPPPEPEGHEKPPLAPA